MDYKPLAALALLAGCPNGNTGAGTLTVVWKMQNADGTPAACPAGYDKMRVSTATYDPEEGYTGAVEDAAVGIFDCAAGSGVLELPGGPDFPGTYQVWLENTDSTGSIVYLTDHHYDEPRDSDTFVIDVSSGSATFEVPIYPTAGWLWLEWSFYGEIIEGNLASCAEAAGADRIEVTATDEAMVTTKFSFTCDGDNGRQGIKLAGARTIGGGMKVLPAQYYTASAIAYQGATEVGRSLSNVGERVEDRNRRSFLVNEFTIHIPSR
jgi:hypothetical protein